jgi:hypothetical protein
MRRGGEAVKNELREEPPPLAPTGRLQKLSEAILDAVGRVPSSQEQPAANPHRRATQLITKAAAEAAAMSAGLAVPLGPFGIVTLIPDLLVIWRIQAQLVADIGAAYGRSYLFVRAAVLWCLFRFASAEAVRTLVTGAGGRLLIRRAPLRALQAVPRVVGIRVTQRVVGRWVSRVLPIVGAVAFAGYAYYDTSRVGHNAIELCERGDLESSSNP